MREALRGHWPEYLMEAAGLGLFMISACLFGTLLGHPGSPAVRALPDPFFRRVLMGLAMGLTAACLIYSPWGQRSGAHFNPATTLTFWRLGKVASADAGFYALAQALGASPASRSPRSCSVTASLTRRSGTLPPSPGPLALWLRSSPRPPSASS
jgi:aquaporin Z